MENTEITLNGSDWSNLYIVDYAGGCGGEKMGDFISAKVDGQFTITKTPTQDPAIDSFDNLYITPLLHLATDDINRYEGYMGKETNGLFHSEEMMKHNLKVNLIHREGLVSGDDFDSLVRDTHFTKNYILRSHRNIDWSSFTNAKIIRIYPSGGAHLTYSLMMLKRWVEPDPVPIRQLGRFMSVDSLEWIQKNVFSKTPNSFYGWQRELVQRNNLNNFSWSAFVEDGFNLAEGMGNTVKPSIKDISPVEWVFGTDSSSIAMVKNATGVDITNSGIQDWQRGNIDILAEHGISMNSTKEECIAYFKDYWNLNDIPCVTEA